MGGNGEHRISGESLRRYSEMARLGHSEEHLAELAPRIEAQFRNLAELWEFELEGTEMAVVFKVERDRNDE